MKIRSIQLVMGFYVALACVVNVQAATNWTADIKNIYTYSNGSARIFLDNLRDGPSGSTGTGCNGDGIWLSPTLTQPATQVAVTEMLSFSLTMFASKVPVRVSIDGQLNDCVVLYMGNI